MRAGQPAQAVDLLGRASARDPDDPQANLGLGIALQAMGRHAEALAPLERAQRALPQGPLAFLRASVSRLALGEAEAALQAAAEACARAPQLAQAHSARGQALMALGDPARAEQAFMAALERAPQWADAWVLCGAARHRQGAIARAEAAFREALRIAPDHAVAKANLAALERAGDGGRLAAATTPDVRRDRAEKTGDGPLALWKPEDPAAALGLAVEYLSGKPAFARLQFGEWSRVLFYQAARGHNLFVVDQSRRVHGFLGWAFTVRAAAEKWVEGLSGLRDDECRAGDCVIVNAFAADTRDANRVLVEAMRERFADKRTLYFKRHYRDGRTRPMRVNVSPFARGRARRDEPRESPDPGVRSRDEA
ncbi:tetratricopeptide repeat protein [Roseiarcus fermentans]|nr:tetratricopeptide repeat protein [Roseiarcus fermentans]